MVTLHKLPNMYKEGSYGMVFFDLLGFATKIMKRHNDYSDNHVKEVFEAEVEAYKLATRHPDLRLKVPEFFGLVKCKQVLDADGKDISDLFYLSLAFKMRKINGKFVKCRLEGPLKSLFQNAGIKHTDDTSILKENGDVRFVIDFATISHELEVQNINYDDNPFSDIENS